MNEENFTIVTGQIWMCQTTGIYYAVTQAEGSGLYIIFTLKSELDEQRADFEFILNNFDHVGQVL